MRLEGLDSLRGFAAVAVVICHTYFITDLPMPNGFRTTAGNLGLAVEMFFMLSAFSMCVGYFGRVADWQGLANYARRRLLRIVPLFYFFIVVWSIYRAVHGVAIPLDAVAATATFTFAFVPRLHASYVAVGWSIGVEMIFYVLFPLLLLVVRDLRSSLFVFATSMLVAAVGHYAIVSIGLSDFVRTNTLVQLPMFAAGIVCFFIFREVRFTPRFGPIAIVGSLAYWIVLFFVIGSPDGSTHAANSLWWRIAICLPFPILLLAFATAHMPVLVNRATIMLGVFSYGVYLWHSLIIVQSANFRREWFAPELVGGVWSSFVLSDVMCIALTIVAAACTYYLIELPFQSFGKPRRQVPAE